MIEYKTGSIFDSGAPILVNPVNTVGVMGAGLALTFRLIFPKMFERYKEICDQSLFHPGQLWLWTMSRRWSVLNFPTKKHYRDWTEPYILEAGLQTFVETYRERGVWWIAFPILGAGHGKMKKEDSLFLMTKYLEPLPDCKVEIWEPDNQNDSPDTLWQEFQSHYTEADTTFARIVMACSGFDQLAAWRGVSKQKISKEISEKLSIEL